MTTQTLSSHPQTWFESFKQQGYYFRQAAILTIVIGTYLHISRLFLGDDLLIQHIFTPTFDTILAFPMAYAGITGLLTWKRMKLKSTAHKWLMGFALFYIVGSIPLHVRSYFTQSTDYIRLFPMWFSVILLPWYALLIWTFSRLQYKDS